MFEELSNKLEVVFKQLRGQGKLTEANIREALRDIRRALLEADVNFKVARQFLTDIESKALGEKVLTSITPAQLIVKIVHDELREILGGASQTLQLAGNPSIVMMCGLQGSGKTTTVAKLATFYKANGKRPMVASIDIHRPAAIEQLRVLAREHAIDFYETPSLKPRVIVDGALAQARERHNDLLIMDTAGRLHIDDEMMQELSDVYKSLNPNHVLFVADGMTGQDAVNAASGFMQKIPFDGVVLTKIDGDTRGGAALSIRAITGKPILFVGTGERIDALDQFYPERFASRILGMGDVVSLVEKAQKVVDEKQAEKLQQKMLSNQLDLEDFLEQLQQMKKLGPLDQLVGMMPGIGKAMKGISAAQDESRINKVEAIIRSMTREERRAPSIIDGSRRKRIASGSGTTLFDVNNVLKQFSAMQKMVRQFSRMHGKSKFMKQMNDLV